MGNNLTANMAYDRSLIDESLTVSPRIGHIAVSVDNFMLIWGGYKEDRATHNEKYLPGDIINIYHSDSKYWTIHRTTGEVPPGTSGAGSYLLAGKLFIFGGFTSAGNTNSLYCLDLSSMRWTHVSKALDSSGPSSAAITPSPRDKFSFWSYNDMLFCFGGFGPPIIGHLQEQGQFVWDTSSPWETGRGWNNQLLVYDLHTGKWSNPCCKGALPSPRAAHGSERIGNNVFIFGGRHRDSRLDDLHRLDLDTYTWSGELYVEGASPCGRSWHSFTKVSDSVIFLYGGYSNTRTPLSDAWQLNTDILQWSQITVPNDCPRLWHTCVCTKDKEILVFGGCCSNILDVQESIVQSSEVLSFLIQPLKLQRLCLEAAFQYKDTSKSDWFILPTVLKEWLLKRETVELKTKPEQIEKDKNTVGSTCCLS